MAIMGIGIDLVEVARIGRAVTTAGTGRRFRERVFTEAECEYCEARASSAQSYAVRFAAKEAVMKALGRHYRWGFAWKDIEVVNDEAGAPAIVLHGRVAQRAGNLGVDRLHLALTHAAGLAIAEAVAERLQVAECPSG